jgi:hypothetical protein
MDDAKGNPTTQVLSTNNRIHPQRFRAEELGLVYNLSPMSGRYRYRIYVCTICD